MNRLQSKTQMESSGFPGFKRDAVSVPMDLHTAADVGNLERVVHILKTKKVEINKYNDCGWTCLMHAASKGHFGIMKELRKAGADPNLSSQCGRTPLMLAACSGSILAAQFLVDQDAELNWKDIPNGWTALFYAVYYKHDSIIKLLVDYGADLNLIDRKGRTPLMLASTEGMAAVVDFMIQKGADPQKRSSYGKTALSLARKGSNDDVIRILQCALASGPLRGAPMMTNNRTSVVQLTGCPIKF